MPRGFSVVLLGIPRTYKSFFRIFVSEGLARGKLAIYVTYDRF